MNTPFAFATPPPMQSIELAHDNATCRLNYAIALYNAHRVDAAKEQLGHFNRLLAAVSVPRVQAGFLSSSSKRSTRFVASHTPGFSPSLYVHIYLCVQAPDSFDEDVSRTHKQLERALNTTPQSMTRDDR